MKRTLQMMLLALVAIMMPIGAWAYETKPLHIDIGTTGVTTLYYGDYNFEIPPEGVSAYVIEKIEKNDDGTVSVVESQLEGIIPAGCGVILRGDEGTHDFYKVGDILSFPDNFLSGVDEGIAIGGEGCIYFYLPEDIESSDWIYVRNEVYIEPHKAYLALPVEDYPEFAEILETLENPHLQHTHGGCEICGQVTSVEAIQAAWGSSADDLTSSGTLADAVTAAAQVGSSVGYIKLQEDVASTEGYNINGGTFTLDLNGYTLTSESHTLYIQNAGTSVT